MGQSQLVELIPSGVPRLWICSPRARQLDVVELAAICSTPSKTINQFKELAVSFHDVKTRALIHGTPSFSLISELQPMRNLESQPMDKV